MNQSVYKRLIHKLIDWLIAFCVACLLLWFVITQPTFKQSTVLQASQLVDVQKLKDHVLLLTGGYAPRTINYDNLNNTADYIYRQFSTVGVPEYQYVNTISKQYRNISLQLGPDTKELYVIGAHYDAEDDSIDTEGNASGVATLIELARHLARNNDSLDIGVILIAYPLSLNQSDNIVDTGSYYHARSLKQQNKNIRLMISLDSVGRINTVNNTNEHPFKFMRLLYPHKENSMNLVGRLNDFISIRELKKGFKSSSELSLNTHNLPESFGKTQSSDHINYWRQGYPAVLISDALYSNISSKEVLKVKPEVDMTERFDYEKMAGLVDGLYQAIIQTSANGDNKTLLVRRARNKKKNTALY